MAHDVLNYYIGKGIVSWTPDGGSLVDVGNVPEFELTPEITTLDHFSSRAGVRSLDRSVVVERKVTLRMILEEWNADNMGIAMTGEQGVDGSSNPTIDIYSLAELKGLIEFQGSNTVGPQYSLSMNVSFKPANSINLISEEWGQMEVTADAILTANSFGLLTRTAVAA